MRVLSTIVLTIVILGLLGVVYIYSGLFNVAADSRDNRVLDWMLSTTSDRSIESRAEKLSVPGDIRQIPVEKGFRLFHDICEKCHGGPGVGETDLRKGLNPRPPDLHKKIPDLTPAVVFWIVKHGIKMSAMPAFGKSYEDQDLFPVVAFVLKFPEISEAEYSRLIRNER